MKRIHLWLDDVRQPALGWMWVKTDTEFQEAFQLENCYIWNVSFDNDLGYTSAMEGWELANWLRDEIAAGNITAPTCFTAHSMNPVASQRIRATCQEILDQGDRDQK